MQKQTYSAFLGVLKVLNTSFLVMVRTCQKACSLAGLDMY